MDTRDVSIELKPSKIILKGDLTLPKGAKLIVFAHGSGSGRFSPRNQSVARALMEQGMGTLLLDLLTRDEEVVDDITREYRFNIPLLAERLIGTAAWLGSNPATKHLKIGYFGASTGAGAALIAAAAAGEKIFAVVSRGGRPDLAMEALPRVRSPTLLIVGGRDYEVIGLNEEALAEIQVEKKLEIVPGATHLFEEPGTLEQVSKLAADWFLTH